MIQAVSEVIIMLPPVEFSDTAAQLRQENIDLLKRLAAANLLIAKMEPVIEATAAWCNGTGSIKQLADANDSYHHWLRNQEQIAILQEAANARSH